MKLVCRFGVLFAADTGKDKLRLFIFDEVAHIAPKVGRQTARVGSPNHLLMWIFPKVIGRKQSRYVPAF